MMLRRAIFLDRDGVINANRPDHVKCWDEFVFLPRALDALKQLAGTAFVVIVTTNQAAINRKMVEEATVRDIHARMAAAIEQAGGRLDAIYYCPHRPDENCACRKPQPGMYLRAAEEWGLDLANSYVVGDAQADVNAARAIGAQPILVLTGRGREFSDVCGSPEGVPGGPVTEDLYAAVEWILQKEQVPL